MKCFQPLTGAGGPGLVRGTSQGRKARTIAMQTTTFSEHLLLLEGTVKATDRLLSAGDRRANFNFALAALKEAVGAARVYIFENYEESPRGQLPIGLGWEWTALEAWLKIEMRCFVVRVSFQGSGR